MTNTMERTAVGRDHSPAPVSRRAFTVIDDLPGLLRVWPALTDGYKPVALDLETYGDYPADALDPYRGDIRLLTVMPSGLAPVVFDLRALGYAAADWSELIRHREVLGHNLRFDGAWLLEKLGLRVPRMFCTMTAAKLLSNGTELRNDLGAVLERFLSVSVVKDQGASDWGGMFLTDDQLEYAANDVRHLPALHAELTVNLKEQGLLDVFDLEMVLLPTVIDMQHEGMFVSRPTLQTILDSATSLKRTFEPELKRHLGFWKNFMSYNQVRDAFGKIGVELPDTSFETLKPVEHPAAGVLLRYRAADMERRQAESLLKTVQTDGRIRCQFKPIGPETGRFASSDPNLQNVKAAGRLRSAFSTPDPGRCLVVADYSQIELRVAAHFSQDREMLGAFAAGIDLHTKTAASVLCKAPEEVTKADRKLAKGLNFGLTYGQGPKGFVKYMRNKFDTVLTLKEAEDYIAAFFNLYQGLAQWHRDAWEAAPRVTEGRTVTGRRRLIPEGEPNWKRFQAKINFVVQGSCADGLKLAMRDLHRKLPDQSKLIATVHDELLVECPRARAEEVLSITQDAMTTPFTRLFPGMPVRVDGKVCSHWGEK
jgi:DNA polymerase I